MATPVWPSGVPHAPQTEPYQLAKRHGGLVATEMEDGPKRQRAASTAIWSQHSFTIRMSEAQYALFDAFLITTLVQGALRFRMPIGRFMAPEPLGQKLAYIEGGDVTVKREAIGFVLVSFTLNVLDW